MTQAILTASSWIQEAIYGFADLMKSWKINRARKAMIKKTRRELSQLSDLGLLYRQRMKPSCLLQSL